jgi:hypothetical protein
MKSAIVFGVMGLGFLLLVLSVAWTQIFPPERRWTEEKSMRMSEVKSRLSNIAPIINSPARMHGGEDVATLKAESIKLEKEFQQLKADFESATEQPKTIANIFKWSGIAIAALGIIGWYAVNQNS